MAHFNFVGEIAASKSYFNRALVAKSYHRNLELLGFSDCDDVTHMRAAIEKVSTRSEIDCGDAGTVLRFMTFRVSRESGWHWLRGSKRLMSRPQDPLIHILAQLGVTVQKVNDGLFVSSSGWKDPKKVLTIDRSISSQFASGLLLNCWNLDFPLQFRFSEEALSESYFQMSLQLVKNLGMEITNTEGVYTVLPEQRIKVNKLEVEADLSSSFMFAVAAVLTGHLEITNWPEHSLQPDHVFLGALDNMEIKYQLDNGSFKISRQEDFLGVEFNLSNCPDLFPGLALLCGHAKGTSRLWGAPHLAAKESNRIAKTAELLRRLGILCIEQADGLVIEGNGNSENLLKSFEFDPDQDHRMAMTAGVARLLGHDIHLLHPEVVNKSCPEFWRMLES